MSQPLPTDGFEWLTEDEISNFSQIKEDRVGYILEVDLEYPSHRHNNHNEYPLAPESIKVDKECLSPYAKETLK